MLMQKLNEIIEVLDNLIRISQEDIENIKVANHKAVFANIAPKEELAQQFKNIKSEIDELLIMRNKPIDEIFTPEEEELFNEFKEKLSDFYKIHKHFTRIALSVANFYNALTQKLKEEKTIDYSGSGVVDSKLALKA
ncbi:MAG: hypothetical protein GXO62_08105 [Epsilonproteobacteria bacterium]|nr:hypothetical protein [Campylobacterota bacterium]